MADGVQEVGLWGSWGSTELVKQELGIEIGDPGIGKTKIVELRIWRAQGLKGLAGDFRLQLRMGAQSLEESGSESCFSAMACPSREPWGGVRDQRISSWIPWAC